MPTQAHRRSAPAGRENPADTPSYFPGEAAHYLGLPPGTVRDWAFGRDYPTRAGVRHAKALIDAADPKGRLLSFLNLVELHVIASIRRFHRVKPLPLRRAIDWLRREFGSRHPLLSRQMQTDGTGLFIERYGQLVDITANGQMALKELMDGYLRRIEWDDKHIPIRLFPVTRPKIEEAPQLVVIDPRVRYGRPCLAGTGVPTRIIA
ncbi:MAG: hypothetical protein J2P46_13255, partial [Zavarzinella sp.]|nr:hypothetical protein [Zavarzinella sp.]